MQLIHSIMAFVDLFLSPFMLAEYLRTIDETEAQAETAATACAQAPINAGFLQTA